MKKYIKMNKNNNELSLGNFCDAIKEISANKNAAIQSQVVCEIFNVDSVNDTTINNYCVGARRIGDEFKEIYIKLKNRYEKDSSAIKEIIFNIQTILNGNITKKDPFDYEDVINSDFKIKELSNKLYSIAKNDKSISKDKLEKLTLLITEKNYYIFLSEVLFFIVLEKKQPVFIDKEKNEIIEKIIENTNISSNDLTKYINLKFAEEINYHHKLKAFAEQDNPYCLMELGISEYKGYNAGQPRYDKAYEYFSKAAFYNHPNALYMKAKLGALYLNKKDEMPDLLKAIELGSVAAINFLALCYLNGYNNVKKNKKKAIEYFLKASEKNYAYAFNNLGKICDSNMNVEKAIYYYSQSAKLGESYGLNKMGVHYYNNKDYKNAYECFNKGINTEIINCCYYNYYNLANLFYENGLEELDIKENISLSIKYYETAAKYNNYESLIKLTQIYYEKFKEHKSDYYKLKFYNIKSKLENHEKFNKDDKAFVESKLKEINLNLKIDI